MDEAIVFGTDRLHVQSSDAISSQLGSPSRIISRRIYSLYVTELVNHILFAAKKWVSVVPPFLAHEISSTARTAYYMTQTDIIEYLNSCHGLSLSIRHFKQFLPDRDKVLNMSGVGCPNRIGYSAARTSARQYPSGRKHVKTAVVLTRPVANLYQWSALRLWESSGTSSPSIVRCPSPDIYSRSVSPTLNVQHTFPCFSHAFTKTTLAKTTKNRCIVALISFAVHLQGVDRIFLQETGFTPCAWFQCLWRNEDVDRGCYTQAEKKSSHYYDPPMLFTPPRTHIAGFQTISSFYSTWSECHGISIPARFSVVSQVLLKEQNGTADFQSTS